MSDHPISQPYSSHSNAEQDLLSTLVLCEDTAPWSLMEVEPHNQPPDETVNSVFSGFDAVLSQGAETFFASLDIFWPTQVISESARVPLLQNLVKRLGTQIPQSILSEIAHKVQQHLSQTQTEMDAAILCVQDVLPHWSLDDWLVFNRPFSYAMRSEQIGVERVLQTLESQTWGNLSDFDQARVCLAIAHYALDLAVTLADTPE